MPDITDKQFVMMMVTAESNLDIIVVGSSSTGYIRSWSRFDVVTLSFSIMKILEYSLRVALVERVRIEPNIDVNCARPVVLISNVAIPFFLYCRSMHHWKMMSVSWVKKLLV